MGRAKKRSAGKCALQGGYFHCDQHSRTEDRSFAGARDSRESSDFQLPGNAGSGGGACGHGRYAAASFSETRASANRAESGLEGAHCLKHPNAMIHLSELFHNAPTR